MKEYERLEELLRDSGENRGEWGVTRDGRVGAGMIPIHYKRISLSESEQMRLAAIGVTELWSLFDSMSRQNGDKLYFTQSVIAGAILSGDYDKIGIISPSQYGKSWLMGRIAIALAYNGTRVNVAASTGDKTEIIMQYCQSAASGAHASVKEAMTGETLKKIDRLGTSLSKSIDYLHSTHIDL